MNEFEKIINDAWDNKDQVNQNSDKNLKDAINKMIDDLDSGKVRVEEKIKGEWITHQHIKNVTKQLGIDDLFDGAFDITDANFVPKPHLDPYKKLIEKFKLDPKKSILIEDIAHNLEQAKNLGMKTCWLENDEAFAKKDADKPYIDYKINNLPSFLQKINVLRNN